MAVKRKGILARPGEYTYKDRGTELKTYEELKAAAQRQPIVTLTYGHPADGVPRAKDFIGTVTQKPNDKKQVIEGDFWFYDETPPEILDRIVNDWPTPISAGFTVDTVEDATQKGISYTHIAIIRDSADPKCPLDKCGVNVRMESNNPQDYRYEQASDPEEKKEPAAEPDPLAGIKEQIAELKTLFIESQKKEPPVEQKPEVVAETPPQKEPEAVRAPVPEPERETPASVPVKDDFERHPVTGGIIFSMEDPHGRRKKTTNGTK